jgi:membrane-bound ClpP family serine protease
METFFLGCFLTGILFTLTTLLFGELLSGWADSLAGHPVAFLQPVVWVGGLTTMGGSGILLLHYAPVSSMVALLLALIIAIVLSAFLWLFYVKPMKRSETSTGFSMKELVGRIGEVTVPIPQVGYGEVMIKVGAGFTNQVAAGFQGAAVAGGQRIVVVEVKNDVLVVSLLEENNLL